MSVNLFLSQKILRVNALLTVWNPLEVPPEVAQNEYLTYAIELERNPFDCEQTLKYLYDLQEYLVSALPQDLTAEQIEELSRLALNICGITSK